MNRAHWLVLVLTLLLAAACTSQPPPPPGGGQTLPGPVSGDLALRPPAADAPGAPDFTAPLTDGTPVTASQLWAQRPVVFTFLSSWCTACAEQQDALSELARTHRDRVVFLGVAGADEPDELAAYLSAHHVDYPVVVDRELTVWRDYAVREPPAVVLISRDGRLLRGWPGGLAAPALQAQLNALVFPG
ncbi:TlpA family protein disulfide reductase [Goodfellowiella coeruleoviolacea]|uniref:Peroxiredoxin n=1 Tax=Goodfellowiella coeruleoviolacea TaxID=334858 RepID=A0AAE3GDC4_9PSEU|nr:TlpA disulfide reductase family protein [Goodfellowiella coeruleoviolacea]MCP2164068.1 Peroxiredoxin [Goodfellowiella coeruleoviolacea]